MALRMSLLTLMACVSTALISGPNIDLLSYWLSWVFEQVLVVSPGPPPMQDTPATVHLFQYHQHTLTRGGGSMPGHAFSAPLNSMASRIPLSFKSFSKCRVALFRTSHP